MLASATAAAAGGKYSDSDSAAAMDVEAAAAVLPPNAFWWAQSLAGVYQLHSFRYGRSSIVSAHALIKELLAKCA